MNRDADYDSAVAERYVYDPYGECTVTVDDSSENPFRFQGQRYCPEATAFCLTEPSPAL